MNERFLKFFNGNTYTATNTREISDAERQKLRERVETFLGQIHRQEVHEEDKRTKKALKD